MNKKSVVRILIPIFLGALLYYIFCPTTLFVTYIDKIIGNGYHLKVNYENDVIRFLRYYLFDSLWAYALMEAVILLIKPQRYEVLKYLVVVGLFEILMESIQMYDTMSGTFDVYDILIEICVNIFVIFFHLWRERREKENL